MEAVFGIQGKDFVLVASDVMVVRSIVVMKQGEDKSRALNENVLLLYNGEQGDAVQFSEYVQRNVQFYGISKDLPLSPAACAHFTRSELAKSLRSRVSFPCFLFEVLLMLCVLCVESLSGQCFGRRLGQSSRCSVVLD
jgi:20S proteasome alpha/beta subunit